MGRMVSVMGKTPENCDGRERDDVDVLWSGGRCVS